MKASVRQIPIASQELDNSGFILKNSIANSDIESSSEMNGG